MCIVGGLSVTVSNAVFAKDVTYYYTDLQGNVLETTDAAGNIRSAVDRRPFGQVALGTEGNSPGYTGHVMDADSGLAYMQARYFDPASGRFLSVDPAVPVPGDSFLFNRFAYANNSPLVHVDRDGRCIWDGCIAEAMFLGAVIGGAIDYAAQEAFHPERDVRLGEVAISAAGGAVTGGSGALFAGSAAAGTITVSQVVIRQAGVSGAVGFGQSIASDVSKGQSVNIQSAVNSAGAGIVGSFIASGNTGVTGGFADATRNATLQQLSSAGVNSEAGIGAHIAQVTQSTGDKAAKAGALQATMDQLSRTGDAASNVIDKKLNEY